MADLTLTELIDTEILNTNGTFFRNREIVEATGASRAHVSQRLAKLWDEGIVEKVDREWMLINQGKLVTRVLRAVRAQELEKTKLVPHDPTDLEAVIQSIQLLVGSRNNWEAYAYRLQDAIVEDINASIENLRALRSQFKTPKRTDKQIYAHMVNSGKYAEKLEKTFVAASRNFLGEDLSDSNVIVDDLRARALRKAEENA